MSAGSTAGTVPVTGRFQPVTLPGLAKKNTRMAPRTATLAGNSSDSCMAWVKPACRNSGSPPIAPTNLAAAVTPADGITVPQTFVTVTWTKSVDDGAGEKDVERYAIYRRLTSQANFDQPMASVVGGHATYSFIDTDLQSGQQWIYGVTALDCSPANSAMVSAPAVTIP